jgi:hypothetical protein
MGRFIQSKADRGSQKWIQLLVNNKPDILKWKLIRKLHMVKFDSIQWLSPKADDDYAEYRDLAFLERLGVTLDLFHLEGFWPARGPQWDGLGKSSSGKLFLVEAKSHIPELISTFKGTSKASIDKVTRSLEETKKRLGVKADYYWLTPFYQYANRIAHVYLLRKNKLEAWLVNVYFVYDSEMKGPETAAEWKGAIRLLHRCLGVKEYLLEKWVVDAFIDVRELEDNKEE